MKVNAVTSTNDILLVNYCSYVAVYNNYDFCVSVVSVMSVTIKHLCYDKLMHTYYCYGYTSTVFDQHRQVVSCPDHTPSCGRVVCMGTRLNRQEG